MVDLFDTIVAQATALGESAVAIVRLSGPDAVSICSSFVTGPRSASLGDIPPRIMSPCVVRRGEEIVDHGLFVRFAAPASFTGEDVVELHLHGNPLIVELVLQLAGRCGARLATPGEFSRRAFLNGKMDLTRVEALGAAIRSESEVALFYAQRQLHGELAGRFGEMRVGLVRLLALLELELDFSEEGFALVAREEVLSLVSQLSAEVAGLLASYRTGERLRRGPRVLLLGLPNAGKSSLFNALVGFNRTLVSPVAGTTRDYIEERLMHAGVVLHLVDSAGLRAATDDLEAAGIDLALGLIGAVDHVLFLVDSTVDDGPPQELLDLIVPMLGEAVLTTVYTKIDLADAPAGSIGVSVLDSESVSHLLDSLIAEYHSKSSEALVLLSRRQFDLLSRLSESLTCVQWDVLDAELLSYELRSVLGPLDQLTGAVFTDEILDEIFSSFCIGK